MAAEAVMAVTVATAEKAQTKNYLAITPVAAGMAATVATAARKGMPEKAETLLNVTIIR